MKKKIELKIATDPKLALQKGRELWADLSKDEPENQARPQTIEELIVLITRESARRMVHLANYTGTTASKVPRCDSVQVFFHSTIHFNAFKYIHICSILSKKNTVQCAIFCITSTTLLIHWQELHTWTNLKQPQSKRHT